MTEFEDKFYSGIRKYMIQEERNLPNVYRISSCVYCKRKSYYSKVLKKQSEPNGKMLSGTLFHSIVPKVVGELIEFKDVEYEKELELVFDGYKVLGHCDGYSKDTLFEFKFTAKIDYEEVPLQYILQSNYYAGIANKPKIKIILIHSDTLKVRCYDISFSQELFDSMNRDILEVHKCISEGKPPLEGPKYSWECRFCPFSKECFEERGKIDEYNALMKVGEIIKKRIVKSNRAKAIDASKIVNEIMERTKK